MAFHKTSHAEQDLGGVRLVEVQAELEFLEACHWPLETSVLVLKTPPGGQANVKKGDRRTVNLTLQFHPTDEGWQLNR